MNISKVISWKFNHQAGMKCKEIDGVMTVVEFPGGVPSQADQDTWTQEYDDWLLAGGDKDEKAATLLNDDVISSILDEIESLPGGAGIRNKIQARLKGKL